MGDEVSKAQRCQCQQCSDIPGPTYTVQFREECLARWYAAATKQKRSRFVEKLLGMKGGTTRLLEIDKLVDAMGLAINDI